jgi:hypothetical protein
MGAGVAVGIRVGVAVAAGFGVAVRVEVAVAAGLAVAVRVGVGVAFTSPGEYQISFVMLMSLPPPRIHRRFWKEIVS